MIFSIDILSYPRPYYSFIYPDVKYGSYQYKAFHNSLKNIVQWNYADYLIGSEGFSLFLAQMKSENSSILENLPN